MNPTSTLRFRTLTAGLAVAWAVLAIVLSAAGLVAPEGNFQAPFNDSRLGGYAVVESLHPSAVASGLEVGDRLLEVDGTPYAALELDPFGPDYAPPGGESWAEFHARVDAAWQLVRDAARRAGGPIAVVTHGLVCLSLAQRHLALLEPGALAPHGFANTSVTSVTREPPHEVLRLNCTLHLGGDAPESAPA